jgi:phosphatidylserine/phosphatidylglycerophosphate/cardiolipin synthase-like enzyme
MLPHIGELDKYSSAGWPKGWPADSRTFWAPKDDIHDVFVALANSATISIVLAMYAFADMALANIISRKIDDPSIFVQLSLDKSQSTGETEAAILAKCNYPATSIAIGNSEYGAIMHLKTMIVDGLYLCTGSTNWSTSGETKQDNQLTVIANSLECANARSRIDTIHDNMLMQMAAARSGRVVT